MCMDWDRIGGGHAWSGIELGEGHPRGGME